MSLALRHRRAVLADSDIDSFLKFQVPGDQGRATIRELDEGDVVRFDLRGGAASGGTPGSLVLVTDSSELPERHTTPSEQNEERYIVALQPGSPAGVQVYAAKDGAWAALDVVRVPSFGQAFARNRGIVESEALSNCCVGIVGLGSGGSYIALELAKAGVGRFVLVDRDTIAIENVGRHICGVGDIGRRKTLAVRDRILEKNPAAVCRLADLDVLEDQEQLQAELAECHVLVGATDSNASRRVVNELALQTGRAAIFGRAYVRASGGDVIRVRDGGPCYDCLFGLMPVEEEVASEHSAHAPAYSDVVVRVEPGLALDIAPIALMCARLVVQELVRGTGSALESLDEDLPGALFLWANRREGKFANWKPMRNGLRDLAVQRWYGMAAARRADCATCNEDAFLANLRSQVAATAIE